MTASTKVIVRSSEPLGDSISGRVADLAGLEVSVADRVNPFGFSKKSALVADEAVDPVDAATSGPAAESAALLFKRIEALNLQNSGSFWHCDGAVLPW
jgi:hypothetical protein